jgi:outer membrane protein insertion porin family
MVSQARHLKSGAAAAALAVALALPGGAALAQASDVVTGGADTPQSVAAPAPGIIQRIRVVGNQRVERETVLAYLSLQPGDPFDPEQVDNSLKTLFATGFFADVQFQQQGGDLVVQVVENPTVNQVLFEGNSSVTTEKLTEEVQIRPRSWFTQSRVTADRRRILEVYRRSGRFAATVTPKIRELPQNRVDVVFDIDDGPSTGIRSINFLGNQAFSDRQLKEVIATEESSLLRFFSSRDNYDPDQLEYDREELRKYYLNRGYYDFRVIGANAELSPDQRDFLVTYNLSEGERYTFGDVRVTTQLDRLSGEVLRAFVPIREGSIYQRDAIDDAVEAITFAAGAAGYAFVDVRPREEADPEGRTVAVNFEVDEGPRVYIERIDVVGNGATLDNVIRRELRLSEGDAFNQVLLDRSRQRVRALGFFKEVEVEQKPGSLPDRAVVEVKVEEQSTGELAFGLGYSNSDAYQFDISITQRNLRGRGQFLRFRVAASSRTRNVDIRFTEPRFLGRNVAAGIDVFSITQDYLEEAGFETETTGLGVRMGFPLAEDRQIGLRYTFRQDRVIVPDSFCFDSAGLPLTNASSLCNSAGDFTTSLAGYTFIWDRRNDPIAPTNGFSLSFSQDLAGVGTGVRYLRSELDSSFYRSIFPGWVGSLRMSGGVISGWNGDTVRINDRFFKGGQSFRGFDIAGLGPRTVFEVTDATTGQTELIRGDALGGKIYAIMSAELTVPLPIPESYNIRAALFADLGTLGGLDAADVLNAPVTLSDGRAANLITEDDLSLRGSLGVSVFWQSPFGPIRIDLSQPVLKEDYDRTENFRFSTAQQF